MSKKVLSLALALAALTVMACGGGGEAPAPTTEAPSAAPATAAIAESGNSAITGTASYANGDPDAAIKMAADPVCDGLHEEPVYSEKVVAAEGNLANVFVYVKSGLTGSYPAPADKALLNQQGCQYSPHVSGIMVGQTLVIKNSDPTLHNVHAMAKKNEEFNQGQPFQNMEIEKTFDKPEVMVPFKCDVHPWMSSYMGVLEHPFFAVTGADGSFSIEGLPAGKYEVEAWHEELGARTLTVEVAADGTAQADFDFSPAA